MAFDNSDGVFTGRAPPFNDDGNEAEWMTERACVQRLTPMYLLMTSAPGHSVRRPRQYRWIM